MSSRHRTLGGSAGPADTAIGEVEDLVSSVQPALLEAGDRPPVPSRRPAVGMHVGQARIVMQNLPPPLCILSPPPPVAVRPVPPGFIRDADSAANSGVSSRRLRWRALCHGSGKNSQISPTDPTGTRCSIAATASA